MVIGDFLPADKGSDYVRSHLIPGVVLRRHCDFTNPEKIKYLVVVQIRADTAVLVINSKIHPFIRAKAHLLECQVKIDTASHCFLNHDSYIACHEAYYLDTADLLTELKNNIASIKGMLSPDVRGEVIKAIENSFTMPREQITSLLNSLTVAK